MSDPSAEPRAGGISAGALVGIALGLMVLAVCAAFLLLGRGGPIDGPAEMQQAFGTSALPFGLEVAQATRMPTGERLVVLERPGAPREPDAPAAPPPTPGERVDWSQVAIPAAKDAPRQAAFLFVDGARGRAVLTQMLHDVRTEDRRKLGPAGGTVLVERGTLGFRGFDSDWVHLRTYEPGATFRDALRMSLSTPERPCVLTATWPRGSAGSKALLEELIAPLRGP